MSEVRFPCSTTVYGCSFSNNGTRISPFGPSAQSRIYRIGTDGIVNLLVNQGAFTPNGSTIPSDVAGFGNICYDSDHHQLFATNLHDGMIYRIDLASNRVVDRFDPFSTTNAPSTNDPNFVALGERPWGIAYNKLDGKLYFSRWSEDRGRRHQ